MGEDEGWGKEVDGFGSSVRLKESVHSALYMANERGGVLW